MNINIYMDIQYIPIFFLFFMFVFFIAKTHFQCFFFFLFFLVRFKGVAWKTTEEIIHFIVIWPYIHKANCIVILFEREREMI